MHIIPNRSSPPTYYITRYTLPWAKEADVYKKTGREHDDPSSSGSKRQADDSPKETRQVPQNPGQININGTPPDSIREVRLPSQNESLKNWLASMISLSLCAKSQPTMVGSWLQQMMRRASNWSLKTRELVPWLFKGPARGCGGWWW
jgi:hypothetical protein